MNVIRRIMRSYKKCVQQKKQFLKVALLDLAFLLLGGYALTKLMDKIAQHLAAASAISSDVTELVGNEVLSTNQLSFIAGQQALFQTFYNKILLLLFLQGFIFFVAWILIEGYGWWITSMIDVRTAQKKHPALRVYLGRFAVITLLFMVLLTIGIWLFGNIATAQLLQTIRLTGSTAWTTVFSVLFVVLGYFWFVGNSLIPFYETKRLWKALFVTGVMDARQYFPAFALVVVQGVVLYKIFVWLSQNYIGLTFAFILIVLPLYMAWTKVLNTSMAAGQ